MNKYITTNILFKDDDYLFINKEAGLLASPDRFNSGKAHLKGMLQAEYPDLLPLHRLDQFTTGVMVFAMNEESHRQGSELFETRDVYKEYIALCINAPSDEKGVIDQRIKENESRRGTYLVSSVGKECITEYEVMRTWPNYSQLRLILRTGRTHQIRVHLSFLGCPLIVDPVYGYYEEFHLSTIKRDRMNIKKGEEESPLLSRTPLHSSTIAFKNPLSGQDYKVDCPLPKDMRAMIYQLDKRFGKIPT